MIEVKTEKLTALYDHYGYEGTQLVLTGFSHANQPETKYVLSDGYKQSVSDINVKHFLEGKISSALAESKDFFEKYENDDLSRVIRKHWQILQFSAGKMPETLKWEITYKELLTQGRISLSNRRDTKPLHYYDLDTARFVTTSQNQYFPDAPAILVVAYGYSLPAAVAFHQYLKGKAHPLYTHYADLRNFLADKKSCKLVFQDGQEQQVKGRYDAPLSVSDFFFFDEESGKWQTKNRKPLEYLCNFKHGRNEFIIKHDVLKQLETYWSAA